MFQRDLDKFFCHVFVDAFNKFIHAFNKFIHDVGFVDVPMVGKRFTRIDSLLEQEKSHH